MATAEAQQTHPIGIYLKIWALLFVFSTFSYLVDIFDFEGLLRWGLIILFMLIKAGFIVAFFMHMKWERLALTYAIILPPVLVLVFLAIMGIESNYTTDTRINYFGESTQVFGGHD
jgi:cytochrome c oxidase subunit IV